MDNTLEPPEEPEPLMWTPKAEQTVIALVKQLRRLVAHHNGVNPTQRVDLARLELHFPEYAMTQWRDLVGGEQ